MDVSDGDNNPNTGFINPETEKLLLQQIILLTLGTTKPCPLLLCRLHLAAGQTLFGRFYLCDWRDQQGVLSLRII